MAPFFRTKKLTMPTAEEALPGRSTPIRTAERHFINGAPLKGPYPEGTEKVIFGLGCFWGAEKRFWVLPGVHVTAVGYADGFTPNPTYEEVCTGMTGHNEVVLVVYDPKRISFDTLLKVFWESHNPTQHFRQGNDVGTQYRSAVYYFSERQAERARATREIYAQELKRHGHGEIMTEVRPAPEFYFAEDYHQQYLEKNPQGYCGLGGTGVAFPAEAVVEG